MEVNLSIFSSNKFVRFLTNGILFLLVLIVVDQVGGSIIYHFYKKTLYGENWPKQNWVTSQPFDVVVFGSSRAFRHYVPRIIGRELNASVFNAGENGQYLLYAYALEQLVLQSYRPRVIVLDVLPSYIIQLEDPKLEFDRLETLMPYVDNPEIQDLLLRGPLYGRVKAFSRLYRFNSRILNIADNIRNGPGEFDNGYVSVGVPRFRPTNKFLVDLMEHPRVDSFKVRILHRFIESARERNVFVVMSFSPTLEPLSPKVQTILRYYRELFTKLDVPFITILSEKHPEFMDKAFFMDYIHMNARGAELFSTLFAEELKKYVHLTPMAKGNERE